jgi:hypothetical protein
MKLQLDLDAVDREAVVSALEDVLVSVASGEDKGEVLIADQAKGIFELLVPDDA